MDLDFDRAHLWHPYTSAVNPLPVHPVTSAQGAELTLADGRSVIDGMSSWWSAIHGYNVAEINAAAQAQLAQMSHVMFGGLTHAPAIALGQRLVQMTPSALDRVFLADSGSVAVEVALKQALQYWQGRGVTGKTRFAALRCGYHGDTTGAMAVTDPINGMHSMFQGYLPENLFLAEPPQGFSKPPCGEILAQWAQQLEAARAELAAVIIEPVVQGAGGMRFFNPGYLTWLRETCDQLDLLLIFDEIATGFGRTGRLFACEHAGVTPDILTLGKALTGGYVTLAATLCTKEVAETVCRSAAGVFMHGPTFMANPLACAIATASCDLLQARDWQAEVRQIEQQLGESLSPLVTQSSVADVRVLGGIAVLEMHEALPVAQTQARLLEQGVWLRPFGKLLYTMPPYVCTSAQLQRVATAMADIAQWRSDT